MSAGVGVSATEEQMKELKKECEMTGQEIGNADRQNVERTEKPLYVIERSVPIPPVNSGGRQPLWGDLYAKMEIGDSIEFDFTKHPKSSVQSLREAADRKGGKIISRRIGRNKVRAWRVQP